MRRIGGRESDPSLTERAACSLKCSPRGSCSCARCGRKYLAARGWGNGGHTPPRRTARQAHSAAIGTEFLHS